MADYVIHHFTHTDLDGVACSVLSHYMYDNNPSIDLIVTYCDYEDINQKVNALLDSLEGHPHKYLLIMLTDISVNADTAKRLEEFRLANSQTGSVLMLDHHQLPEDVKSYKWAMVTSDGTQCGASLMYNYFMGDEGYPAAYDFTENVKAYDLWKFDPDTLCKPLRFQMLLNIFGRDAFAEMIVHELNEHPRAVIDLEFGWVGNLLREQFEQANQYIAKKTETAQDVTYNGLHGKYVFAEQHVSRLGNNMLKAFPEADFAAVVQPPNRVSLRSRDDGVNVGLDIAKHFGGGGHHSAAGYTLNEPLLFTME